jgi:hypothetical protein
MPAASSFSIIDCNYSARSLEGMIKANIIIKFSLVESAKNEDLKKILEQNNTFIDNGNEYAFTVQSVATTVNNNGVLSIVNIIEVQLDIFHAAKILNYLFDILHKNGYGLPLHGRYTVRAKLNIGTEEYYLEHAQQLIKPLKKKGDNPLTIEYQALLRLCNEFIDNKRGALVYKIARILQFNNLYQCALGLISSYLWDDKFHALHAELLANICNLSAADVLTLKKQVIATKENKINGFLSARVGDFFVIKFISNVKENFESLFNFFNKLELYSCDGKKLYSNIEFAMSESQYAAIFKMKVEDVYVVFEQLFMRLSKSGMFKEIRVQYDIKRDLGLNNLNDYVKFAKTVIDFMPADDLLSFEYNWLVSMSHELPVNIAQAFAIEVIKVLKDKNFLNCALGLSMVYYNDSLCKILPPLVQELHLLHYLVTKAFLLVKPHNEDQEDKNKRLESYIRSLIANNHYTTYQSLITNMFCELAGAVNGDQNVLKNFNPNNLDASFRFADNLRHQAVITKLNNLQTFSNQALAVTALPDSMNELNKSQDSENNEQDGLKNVVNDTGSPKI